VALGANRSGNAFDDFHAPLLIPGTRIPGMPFSMLLKSRNISTELIPVYWEGLASNLRLAQRIPTRFWDADRDWFDTNIRHGPRLAGLGFRSQRCSP
jgi:hypothetical protein